MKVDRNNKGAFTLIELLVVVSIIALLVSILMPALGRAREQAKKVVCLSGLKQLGLGCHFYAMDNNDKLPPASGSSDSLGTYKIFMGGWANLGTLYSDGHIEELKTYWCPSAKGYFGLDYNMNRRWVETGDHRDPLPNNVGENVLRSSYQFRGKFLGMENQKWINVPQLAIAMDVFYPSSTLFHSDGYNVAFIDGSGSFFKVDPENNELEDIFFNPVDAHGYLSWRQYYSDWNWRGGRAVWAVLDASY